MASSPTPNRGYFRPTKGMISRASDWNAGLIDKLDADVQQVTDDQTAEENNHGALKKRVDAVVSDEGASSRILRPVREFRPMATGENPYSPEIEIQNGGWSDPVGWFQFANDPADWTSEFTIGRRVKVVPTSEPVVFGWVWSSAYIGWTVVYVIKDQASPPWPTGALLDVELSRVQYGGEAATPSRISDGSIAAPKLNFDPATQAELDAVQNARQAETTQLSTDEQQFETDLATHAAASVDVHGSGPGNGPLGQQAMQGRISTHDASPGAHLSAAFAGIEQRANKGQPNGYVPLDAFGQVDGAYLPTGLGIKSVQEIESYFDIGAWITSYTINAVDVSKTFLTVQVEPGSGAASGGERALLVHLTGPTFVLVQRDRSTYRIDFHITVTEFN